MKIRFTNKKLPEKTNVLIALCMVIFIDTLAMTLVCPLFAPLFSLDVSQGGFFSTAISLPTKNILYGLTMAIYPVFMFLTSPLLGDLSDRVGRKKVLLLCLLGAGIAGGLSGLATVTHSFILFFIGRIMAGSVAGSLPIAQAAIIDISHEHNKTINISLIGFAYTLGLILGPITGGFLSNKNISPWFGLPTPFFGTIAISVGNSILLMFTFKETLAAIGENIELKTIRILKPLMMFVEGARNRVIYPIMLASFFYILGWSVYFQVIGLYLFRKYQFTAAQIGYFFGWLGLIMSVAMALIIRALVRYLTTLQILYLAIMLPMIGILMCMASAEVFQWLSTIPIACGVGLAYTTITKLFSDAVDAKLQGWAMGVSASVMAVATALGGLLAGLIAGSEKITFISIITIWTLSFSLSFQMANRKAKMFSAT